MPAPPPPILFPLDPLLSFPLFETYRLAPSPTQSSVHAHPLPAAHRAVSWNARYPAGAQGNGFKEVKKRVDWDGLSAGGEGEVYYVDEGWNVVQAEVVSGDEDQGPQPLFTAIHSLPRPIRSTGADAAPLTQPETPSVCAVPGSAYILASSGAGDLVLLEIASRNEGTSSKAASVLAELELHLPGSDDDSTAEGEGAADVHLTPFVLHAASLTAEGIEALLTRTIRRQVGVDAHIGGLGASRTSSTTPRTRMETSFEVVCAIIPLPAAAPGGESSGAPRLRPLDIKWRMASEDMPKMCSAVVEEGRVARWIVAGPSELREVQRGGGKTIEAKDDSVPSGNATSKLATSQNGDATPPFTWTQTSTSLHLIFDLPPSLDPSRDIACLLRPHTLALLVYPRGADIAPTLAHWLALSGTTGTRDWWDAIRADESTWTFERPTKVGASAKLELHLEKANPGTRWPSVFAPYIEGAGDATPVDEVDVPETIGEEEAQATADRLAQYTSEFGQAGLGADAAASLPGLLREEMEDEDDFPDGMRSSAGAGLGSSAKAGKEVLVSYVEADANGGVKLRTPMKGRAETALSYTFGAGESGVIIKSHVDGAVFSPPASRDTLAWQHRSTSPALSFVLSSKRDAQFVYHHAQGDGAATTYAFESRQASGLGGNLYIYYPVDETDVGRTASGKSRATRASQAVVKFGVDAHGEEMGSLLGVKMLQVKGKPVIVGLCERVLVLL